MFKHKGFLMCVLLLMVVLTGCGKEAVKDKEEQVNETTEQKKATATSIETAEWPRTYTDGLGKEIVIEQQPERLASLWFFYPEILAALDETPVGTTEKEFLSTLSYLEGKLDTTEELGEKTAPDIEKLLSTQPDIILATEHQQKIYDALVKVAPVVTLNSADIFNDWQYGLREVAKVIGKEDKAEAVIEQMMSDISIGRTDLAKFKEESIALIVSWDGKTFNVLGEDSPIYTLAFDKERGLGLTPDDGFTGTSDEFASFEGISSITADHIFLIGDITKKDKLIQDIEESQVWNNLNAVQKDNVYMMDTSALTAGPLAIQYALDNMITALQNTK
ncbi:ABC transporter substrate-binding protein [Lysinibacillus alkalisoli]|uniref:ABC transporter substrate-binding protein n=1 Tax=Lysinibacillus alkalisoli TaxID=1911548 RepID=A0A917G8M2_9BACI|nr:ABC transporter substrate-binding protein [Lysinibacillus alkalisoli]GGG28580.1 ABC transporter substrate-binding protein [Lysinibacillus alkalisoli]